MHTAALLAIICLGLVASVAHVDAGGARPFIKEDVGYYDDEPYDGSIVDSIVGIILVGLFLGMFWGGIAFLSYLINRLRRH